MKRYLLLVLACLAAAMAVRADDSPVADTLTFQFHFRLDSSHADTTYLTNGPELRRLADAVRSHKGDKWININSQSSPEGPYAHNLDLSRRRAASIRSLLASRMPGMADRIVSVPDGESWGRLRCLVVADSNLTAARRDRILAVIDADMPMPDKKRAMQRLPEYGYLKKKYYPIIRNSLIHLTLINESTPPNFANS